MMEIETILPNEHSEDGNEMHPDINGTEKSEMEEVRTDKNLPSVRMYLKDNVVTFIPVHSIGSDITKESLDDLDQKNKSLDDLDQKNQSLDYLDMENEDLESDADKIPYKEGKTYDENNSEFIVDETDHIPCRRAKNGEDSDYEWLPNFSSGDENIMDSYCSIVKKKRKSKSERTIGTLECKKCRLSFSEQHEYSQHLLNDHHHDKKGTFACGTCQKVFKHEVSLHYHMARHFHKTTLFSCTKCRKRFNNESALAKHMHFHEEDEHDITFRSETANTCSICSAEFDCENTFKEHLLTHCDMESFTCGLCNKKIENLQKLKRHLRSHDLLTFECTICGQVFNRKCNLNRHVGIHTGERKFACSHCDTDFRENKDLRNHFHKKHPEIYGPLLKKQKPYPEVCDHDKPWKCEHCDKAFRYQSKYNDHMMSHTGEHPNAVSCPDCDKKFVSNSKMKRHFDRIHIENKAGFVKPVLEDRYFCEVCGKGFHYPSDHQRHLECHSSIRNVCELCGQGFKLKKELNNHKAKEHSNHESEKEKICEMCGRRFQSVARKNNHLSKCPSVVGSLSLKKFYCAICDHTFNRKSRFDVHNLQKHTASEDRPTIIYKHLCDHCGKSFQYPSELKQHVNFHFAGTFGCDVCGNKYKEKKGLIRHQLKSHGTRL